MSVTLTRAEEREARRLAGASRCPVEVIPGASPPAATGERGYSEFKKGGRCHHPGGAIAAGYKVYYVPSTYRVEVGADWVLRRRLEAERDVRLRQLRRLRPLCRLLRRTFAADVPPGVAIDWLQERGEAEAEAAALIECEAGALALALLLSAPSTQGVTVVCSTP